MGISMDGEEAEKDEPDQMILVDVEEMVTWSILCLVHGRTKKVLYSL